MRPLLLSMLLSALVATSAHGAEDARRLGAFRAIAIHGPVNIEVHAGKTQSVKVMGRPEFIGKVMTSVKADELRIDYAEKSNASLKDGDRIVVTVPSLVKCIVEGAGQVVIDNVKEERIDLQFEGAGRLEAKGSTKWLRLKARGVGAVVTQELKAERADVNFEGIGEVKVHASQTLNAVVRGMGSLTYYGRPKALNKSVSGIGSVSAGD
jgi:Putative auto-transporter adhesin, head GIN domain